MHQRVLFDPGASCDPSDHGADSTTSPGGNEENTGAASKLRDRLTMGSIEVTSSDPVKLVKPNRAATFCASCPPGNKVLTTELSTSPAVFRAVKKTEAVLEVEGLA